MRNIVAGQTLTGTGTVLDVFLTDPSLGDALLRAPATLSFALVGLSTGARVQLFPATSGNVQAVDLVAQKIGTGHFYAAFTVPSGSPPGPAEMHWQYVTTSGFRGEVVVPVEILALPSLFPGGYCSLSDVRAEGIASAGYPDARVLRGISMASQYIERVTERWFEPRYRSFTIDGEGNLSLPLPAPIVAVDMTIVTFDGTFAGALPSDPQAYKIYARHLTDNMLTDDDRNAPKLQLRDPFTPARLGIDIGFWPPGRKNIRVIGVFGYTDYDGSPMGKTPDLIRDACTELTLNYLEKKATAVKFSGPVSSEKTRDQEVEYLDAVLGAAFTGDPYVDSILESFRRPPIFVAA